MSSVTISVSQLNKYVKSLLDGDGNLKSLFIAGEISNLKVNSFSGHMYFTLKDNNASVKAVMFKSYAERLRFLPEEGMGVICRGSVTMYEKDGVYQLYVNDIMPDGAGSIALAFEQLKNKLAGEGLFDASKKKPIPKFPKKIAVITSATGAAVHDMINVISRRWPLTTIIMCPVSVQGDLAPKQMIKALQDVCNQTDSDVIIIGRGGGSAEDLWCFNDEGLARAIFSSKIPVISAVGHETDFTICDFVADLRAPTPSAAAEIAVPDIEEIFIQISSMDTRLRSAINNEINTLENKLNILIKSKQLSSHQEIIAIPSMHIDNLLLRLEKVYDEQTANEINKFSELLAKLDALDPMKILKRGYSVVEKDGVSISSIENIATDDILNIRLIDGSAKCTVNSIERGK